MTENPSPRYSPSPKRRATAAVFALAGALAIVLTPAPRAWSQDRPAKPAAVPQVRPPTPLNIEKIYYSQFRLLAQATNGLAKHRPGVPDLYFLGFGGDAGADVFLREVRSVGKLFDERFDTRGRSVLLINNRRTVAKQPLANSHNLLAALDQIRLRMNPEEDVLFLFVTTHGEVDRLAVDFPPLDLNDLLAKNLKFILDKSKIKWRVIVLSACYSGSFIDDLKNDNSLIVTAARADRTSFGCATENDYTYFGRAYFDRALRDTFSFIDAYDQATETVGKWEKKEDLKPSLPQIYIGAAIRPKLKQIEERLRRRHASLGGKSGASPTAVCCGAKPSR